MSSVTEGTVASAVQESSTASIVSTDSRDDKESPVSCLSVSAESCDEPSTKNCSPSSPSSSSSSGPPKQAKSSRTPYSTFKMSEKDPSFPIATSDGNILKFTPPGFRHELEIKFPDGRLAVCTTCKTNFKTRQVCRVTNGHTCAPWSTAYVCITLDETCTNEAGRYVEDELVAEMAPWKAFDMVHAIDLGTPVCASCKKINHARKFCRERHRHRQLPWSTVYVTLSAKKKKETLDGELVQIEDNDDDDASSAGAASTSGPSDLYPEDLRSGMFACVEAPPTPPLAPAVQDHRTDSAPRLSYTDDIHDIPSSRTFLVSISNKAVSLEWIHPTQSGEDGQVESGGRIRAIPPPSYLNVGSGYVAPAMCQATQQVAHPQQQIGYSTPVTSHSMYPMHPVVGHGHSYPQTAIPNFVGGFGGQQYSHQQYHQHHQQEHPLAQQHQHQPQHQPQSQPHPQMQQQQQMHQYQTPYYAHTPPEQNQTIQQQHLNHTTIPQLQQIATPPSLVHEGYATAPVTPNKWKRPADDLVLEEGESQISAEYLSHHHKHARHEMNGDHRHDSMFHRGDDAVRQSPSNEYCGDMFQDDAHDAVGDDIWNQPGDDSRQMLSFESFDDSGIDLRQNDGYLSAAPGRTRTLVGGKGVRSHGMSPGMLCSTPIA
eukprot:CAMPEP_0194297504 /NCGR_PEP_ID=MMETSP0169-20130528/59056_1 /TAXON_ID=218684 /ORGANISM="Corethron pennatum, Strain L29A3" /LENGTH=653 /DNA_ID=CAMNT_0039047331 /DNA_START=99 /DNA_END=2056 /DNA_ORIENTATION=+